MPGSSSTTTTSPSKLAERFWSLARAMDKPESADDPKNVVRHVLAILDALDTGEVGEDLTANTVSFLALLHQSEAQGDLLYASPEQARGERMDERSLVFSIGVLIFEKLTGRHPFGADGNPRRLARIQKAEMASGVAYFQTISGPLRTILLKCMGPFPDERWRTVAELRQQLEAFVEDRSEARVSRDLPALPAENDVEDDDVTIMITKPASPKALSVAAERESVRRPQSIVEPLPVAPAGMGLVSKVTWMLAGGAIAALAIWFVGGRASGDGADKKVVAKVSSSPRVDSSAGAPAVVPATPAPVAEPIALRPKEDVIAAPPTTTQDPVPPPPTPTVQAMAPPSPDPSMVFDIELGGKIALAATLSCLSAERVSRSPNLGISLFYPRDGVSKKIFFGDEEISDEERQCLSTALLGLSAGGVPEKPTTVNYNFFFAGEKTKIRARLAK